MLKIIGAALLDIGQWLLVATLAWAALFVVESIVDHGAGGTSVLAAYVMVYAFSLSAVATLVLGGCVGWFWLARLRWRYRLLLGASAVALVGGWAAWAQAEFLTSGRAISSNPHVGAIRWAAFAALVVGLFVLVAWHVVGTVGSRPVSVSLGRLAKFVQSRTFAAAWTATGCLALLGLLWVAQECVSYQYFCAFLMGPLWLIAATLAWRWLDRGGLLFLVSIPCAGAVLVSLPIVSQTRRIPQGLAHNRLYELSLAFRYQGLTRVRTRDLVRNRLSKISLPTFQSQVPRELVFAISEGARRGCHEPVERRLEPPTNVASSKRRNVLLVSIESLRADALERSEVDREKGRIPVTPYLNQFAARGWNFSHAMSPYPATSLGLGAAYTGYRPALILLERGRPRLALERAGFDEVAFFFPNRGWFRGARVVEFFGADRMSHDPTATQQTDHLIERLRAARGRGHTVFAGIHYFDSHHSVRREHQGPEFGHGIAQTYWSSVWTVDREFGRLAEFLTEEGWLDDTLVVVFSDHGEALGEHNVVGHDSFLYKELLDIVLLVHFPGVKPATLPEPVWSPDVAATVLHYMNAPVPTDLDGESLFVVAEQPNLERRFVSEAYGLRGDDTLSAATDVIADEAGLATKMGTLSISPAGKYSPLLSAVTPEHRLIVNRRTGAMELFDRRNDPAEVRDVFSERPKVASKLRTMLVQWAQTTSDLAYCRFVAAGDETTRQAPPGRGLASAGARR